MFSRVSYVTGMSIMAEHEGSWGYSLGNWPTVKREEERKSIPNSETGM